MDGTRWCDNGNGTVRDMTTGLIWLKDANCVANLGGVNKTGTLNWDNANTWVYGLANGSCGLTDGSVAGDWFVPSLIELKGAANGTEPVRSGTPRNFSNVQGNVYWSSSSSSTSGAWIVSMDVGFVGNLNKNFSYYVWPVRSGQ
jgi:hypothetical protein